MDPLSATLREVIEALDSVGIRYAIGGSLASSARSIWRSTADVDLIAAILPTQVGAFIRALGNDWYADVDEARRAISARRSFNLIHMKSVQKVDVFPAHEAFHRTQLDRATILNLTEDRVPCRITTAEDILLAKLRWYADGGQVSERQWNDITTLIAINVAMDWEYVADWAPRLGVSELLKRAQADARR
ncbi:MAG TPA: hypothetical protein VNV86_19960 [Candidatus Acidoferrum sp.]|nr:hypothetical protein [Candidatus Acidoferrum sp.]